MTNFARQNVAGRTLVGLRYWNQVRSNTNPLKSLSHSFSGRRGWGKLLGIRNS